MFFLAKIRMRLQFETPTPAWTNKHKAGTCYISRWIPLKSLQMLQSYFLKHTKLLILWSRLCSCWTLRTGQQVSHSHMGYFLFAFSSSPFYQANLFNRSHHHGENKKTGRCGTLDVGGEFISWVWNALLPSVSWRKATCLQFTVQSAKQWHNWPPTWPGLCCSKSVESVFVFCFFIFFCLIGDLWMWLSL